MLAALLCLCVLTALCDAADGIAAPEADSAADTPETVVTIEPEYTAVPEETTEPEMTAEPEVTAEPEATAEPVPTDGPADAAETAEAAYYVVLSADKTTLTFQTAAPETGAEGTDWWPMTGGEVFGEYSSDGWHDPNLKETVTQVVIRDDITLCGAYLFYGFRALTGLTGPGRLTLRGSAKGMFARCRALTALDLAAWDTSNVTDMSEMFEYCPALTQLDLTGWDTSNVTDMRYMFSHCDALQALKVGDGFKAQGTEALPDTYTASPEEAAWKKLGGAEGAWTGTELMEYLAACGHGGTHVRHGDLPRHRR